jgi:tRNA (guanine-N7-)-methyltransferase
VEKVEKKARRRELPNLKVFRVDLHYAIHRLLPPSGCSRLHLLFPDPWPKKRDYKHRLIKPDLCGALHQALQPGGDFLFKTDHAEYFEDGTAIVEASGLFDRVPWSPDDFFYPQTDFERQWLAQGCSINWSRFIKKGV